MPNPNEKETVPTEEGKTNREIFAEAMAEANAEAEGNISGGESKKTEPTEDSKNGADQTDENNPVSDQQEPAKATDADQKSDKTKPADEVEPKDGEEPKDNADTEQDDLPVAMARKYSDKWKNADSELKAEVIRVLENDQQTIARFKAKTKSLEDAISVANPEIFADVKKFGITKEQSVKNRLAYISAFQRNPDETFIAALTGNEIKLNNPAGLIRAIASHANLNLETLTKVDPSMAILEDKNAAYEARMRAAKLAEQAKEEAKKAEFENELVEEARAFLDRHPEIVLTDMLKKQMDYEGAKIIEANPNISTSDLFEQAYAEVVKMTTPKQASPAQPVVKKEIPRKPTVGLKSSDDAGEGKMTMPNFDISDPNSRRKLFAAIAKETGFTKK